MNSIDQLCAEASARLSAQTEARIDAYRKQAAVDAERTRRSQGQIWRWLRTQLMQEFKAQGEASSVTGNPT